VEALNPVMIFESVSRKGYKTTLIIYFQIQLNELAANIKICCEPHEVSHAVWVGQTEVNQIKAKETGQIKVQSADGSSQELALEDLWPWYSLESKKGMSYAAFRLIERL
jgi:hypothetical protein